MKLSKGDIANYRDDIRTQYFIDTDGVIRKWKLSPTKAADYISLHYGIAAVLFPDIIYPKDPKDHVMKLGWVLVGSTVYGSPIIDKCPTQAQLNTLLDLDLYDRLLMQVNDHYPKYKDIAHLCD